jgi:hypothetical protein
MLGKDQKEIWPDQSPSITIYTGEEVHNGPPQRAVYAPDHHVVHQAYPDFATYLIKAFRRRASISTIFRPGRRKRGWPRQGMKPDYPVVPHAYSFVYHQIMGDDVPRHVPVLFNLFYPPTQPSMARCIGPRAARGHRGMARGCARGRDRQRRPDALRERRGV